jgi:hypothetical protein
MPYARKTRDYGGLYRDLEQINERGRTPSECARFAERISAQL